MATVTYTVVKNDTLSGIAQKHNTTVSELARINHISNVDLIYVGQVLVISNDSGESVALPRATTNKPVLVHFGVQSNTERTFFATWRWEKENTKEYNVRWFYDTGDKGIWFIGEDSNVKDRQSIYTPPENAKRIRFTVKAVSNTYSVNNVETVYWVGDWSTAKVFNMTAAPPLVPPVPNVEIKDYTLTATLDNLNVNASYIEFEVIRDNATRVKLGSAKIVTYHAEFSCAIQAGYEYKVRCRSKRGTSIRSEWSEFSENQGTKPKRPNKIKTCKAASETSIFLEWELFENTIVSDDTTYDIQYTTKLEYFDSTDQISEVTGIKELHYTKTGLEIGQEYFFRVRATNERGSSDWTAIKSTVLGKKPIEPTTWSSTTTCTVGEPLTLHWMHNAEDGSSQTYAQVELTIDGTETTHTIDTTEEEDDEKTMYYEINTSQYVEGTNIQWRARTAGVTKKYGDWSVSRTVDIYAPPTLELTVTNSNDELFDVLESFPFKVAGVTGPASQKSVSYHLTVIANESYETVDSIGNFKMVTAGEEIYTKNVDTRNSLSVQISANDISLENNKSYTVKCIVSMDSGLTAEDSFDFEVAWTDDEYEPNAEIGIDPDSLSASICPFCTDEDNQIISGITLSVYRREPDGSFTEIATGIPNGQYQYVTDPHPSLDYARYRVVATQTATGAISYADISGYPIGEQSIVIQWDEDWSVLDTPEEDEFEQPAWAGSMLKLPYNIAMDTQHDMDVTLVKYIGRKHPVSYYGTHVGETANWSVAIPKTDTETLYALRRLAVWPGNVYVREPSGSGYWANVGISFQQNYQSLTIPVTISVTRVEGGL